MRRRRVGGFALVVGVMLFIVFDIFLPVDHLPPGVAHDASEHAPLVIAVVFVVVGLYLLITGGSKRPPSRDGTPAA